MAKRGPLEFIQEVGNEGAKVTWPTRRETLITTALVFVMAIMASVFFLLTDQILRWGVGLLLGLGR